jgi:NAD(P)-dependent dehydrogenase (short-subunit alcohol dehydrogenase family)
MAQAALAGRTALITGGSGGIGCACAEALARDGAAVVLMARRADELARAQARLRERIPGARVETVTGDAAVTGDVEAAVARAFDLAGRLDTVVATVGGGAIRPLLMHDADSFRADLEVNLLTAFLAVRYSAPALARSGGGSIVCISSDAAKLVFPWLPGYVTAKAGLEGFVRAAAEELARVGIRVNAVRPGLTRTTATQALFADPEIRRRFAAEKPLGRLGEPEDVAAGVRYLAGPESSWVTGQSFAIEGGNELRKAPDLGPLVEAIYGKPAFEAVLAGRAPLDDRG